VSVYCTASKRILLHWHITSVDLPGIMFVKFFCEKYLLDMHKHNGNTHLPTLCTGEATVKINKLWPNVYVHSSLAGVWKNAWQYIPPMIHYLNTKKHIPSHSYAQHVEASTYNRLTQTSQKIMQISREIRGEWLPNLHHLATYQSVHCRRPSGRTFPPPHSGTCTCSRSPTEPPPTHHLVLPPPPSQRGPLLRPDPPTTSPGHEQHVNLNTAPYLLHAQSARRAGNSHNGDPAHPWNTFHEWFVMRSQHYKFYGSNPMTSQ